MISRRNFLKGAAVALVVPLPSLVLGETKTVDTGFTIKAVEVKRGELDFNTYLHLIAISDKPIRGKIITANAAIKFDPDKFTIEEVVDEIKPNIQIYFNDKIRSGAWS